MKKILILFAVILCTQVNAQIKEGTVKFKMVLDGASDNPAATMLGNTTLTLSFKNDKSLTQMATSMYSMTTLTDSKGLLMLMDGGGQKFFSRKTKEEIAKDKAASKTAEPVLVFTKEKKKILGYDCTKVLITTKDGKGREAKMIIWYTDKIHPSSVTGLMSTEALNKLNGMSLEVDMDQGPIKSKMTAVEISTKPVPDNVFNLSTAGYTERKATPPIKR